MRILSFESSCDETAACLTQNGSTPSRVQVISHVVSSSMALHAKTGGIIPEMAARSQLEYIIPVIQEVFHKAHLSFSPHTKPAIDAIAVTVGPGLIGSLLVGVEAARVLSYVWNIPLIPINHLIGHLYANFLETEKNQPEIQFPAIGLIVSGGHTDLLLLHSHTKREWLGGTRDDAAGEVLDKVGRAFFGTYPAGALIEQEAAKWTGKTIFFPRPLLHDASFSFSFSGLKTAVLREIQKEEFTKERIPFLAKGLQDAILSVLVAKTLKAATQYNVRSVLIAGGVAANTALRHALQGGIQKEGLDILLAIPEKQFCTDNAAMIGAAAHLTGKQKPWQRVVADPQLYFFKKEKKQN